MKEINKSFFCFLMLTLLGSLLSEEDPFETCLRYTSFGYGYRDFFEFHELVNFPPNQVFYLEFFVKTNSDAHILLKSDVSGEDGYEIVIGGGSNTFSQIRFLEGNSRKTMITQKTENLLSAVEYKSFWISMDKLGIISVGKKEKDDVFINWRFDEPFPIKYFSFGSWTNMKADWRFGCTMQKDSGSHIHHEEGVMSPERKLKRDLFTLYDPNALPVEKYAILDVRVNFQINTVQLDERRGQLTMHGMGNLKWSDGKIKWQPDKYDGIENLYVPPFLIWTPSIRVLNALALDKSPLFDLTAAGVVAKYDGSIFWRPPFKSVSHCKVDLKYWPFDVHNCSVFFGFWLEPWNLKLTMTDDDTISDGKTESGWQIAAVLPFNTNYPDEDENDGVLYVELRRANGPLAVIIMAPYFVATILTLAAFWIPLQSPLKLHLMCGSVIILVLTLFLAGQSVPAMTSNTPKIINSYSWTTVIACIPIILTVVLRNIIPYVQAPKALSKILRNNIFGSVFCLPDLDSMVMEYTNFNENVNKLNIERLTALRLITVIERIFFLLYVVALYFLF